MKIPGPDHPITITANPKRVRALFQGHVIADSGGALTLQEAGYKPVQYFPRDDVDMAFLSRTSHSTHCPYKGDASYFTISRDGKIAENKVWSYEEPYDAVGVIRGHLAFYPDTVEVVEAGDGGGADAIRDIVEHTDSGSGQSQLERWPATATVPSAQPADIDLPFKDSGAL
jgi:uncharacterized protein (DUF427 family)